jgi:hypothetical protein
MTTAKCSRVWCTIFWEVKYMNNKSESVCMKLTGGGGCNTPDNCSWEPHTPPETKRSQRHWVYIFWKQARGYCMHVFLVWYMNNQMEVLNLSFINFMQLNNVLNSFFVIYLPVINASMENRPWILLRDTSTLQTHYLSQLRCFFVRSTTCLS